jgi:signal transduction histidine kinase
VLLDQIDGVVIELDATTLRATHASASLASVVGEPAERWSARPESWRQLFDPEDWPRVARLCRAVARDGRRRRVQHLLHVHGRRPRWFRTSVGRVEAPPAVLVAHMMDLGGEQGDGIAAQQAWTREILRHAPLGLFVLDRKGVVRLAEGRGLERLRIEPCKMVGKSMVYGAWPCHWIVENAQRVLRGDTFSEVNSAFGAWLSLKYVPLRDGRGRLRGALGFVTDITECKRAVDLLETVDAVLWEAQGSQLQLCYAGGSAERLFGPEVAGWPEEPAFFERHLFEAERENVLAVVNTVTTEGEERTIVHRIVRGDGKARWCRTTLRPLPPDAAGHRHVLGLTLDITERRLAEKALDPDDRRWHLLSEQVPAIVYSVDRQLCITSGVGAGLRSLGLARAPTLVGIPLEQYFQISPGSTQILAAHREALAGKTVRTESAWLGRSFDLTLEPLRSDDAEIIGVVGVAVDVTERHRQERQRERLLEAERAAHAAAEDAVRVRDQFLSVASHELRTPLGGLLLTLQATLQRMRGDGTTSAYLHSLELVERQALRLGTLIGQLLDASRLGAGQQLELSREPLDLAALARSVVERFEVELQRAGVTVRLLAGDPVLGAWDRSRMDQLITNLLSNAIKYGKGGPLEISVESEGQAAVLRVRDHGIGIAVDDVPRIFRPFQRLHEGQRYGGLGLGLFIVREIARAHGGDIRVDSEVGQGSCFTVELPRATPG